MTRGAPYASGCIASSLSAKVQGAPALVENAAARQLKGDKLAFPFLNTLPGSGTRRRRISWKALFDRFFYEQTSTANKDLLHTLDWPGACSRKVFRHRQRSTVMFACRLSCLHHNTEALWHHTAAYPSTGHRAILGRFRYFRPPWLR